MAHQRLAEPIIDTYGSRRAWKRHRRVSRGQRWARAFGPAERAERGPSLGAVALASMAILTGIVIVVLVLSQVASAFGG